MSERIIDKIARLVNQGELSLAEAVEIEAPDGDLAYWQRQLDKYDPDAPKPKRKRVRRAGSGSKRKRSAAYALTVRNYLATAELVSRVNNDDE